MPKQNQGIILTKLDKEITENNVELRYFSEEDFGTASLDAVGDGWMGVSDLPNKFTEIIGASLLGPDDKGPVIDFPKGTQAIFTITRFIPGNSKELCGILQITDPNCESDPMKICCKNGELCQPSGCYPAEFQNICEIIDELRKNNDGGLPIKLVTQEPLAITTD